MYILSIILYSEHVNWLPPFNILIDLPEYDHISHNTLMEIYMLVNSLHFFAYNVINFEDVFITCLHHKAHNLSYNIALAISVRWTSGNFMVIM